MNNKLLIKFLSFFILLSFSVFAQLKPQINFVDLLEKSEINSSNKTEARFSALKLDQPWSIYTTDGVFAEALSVENNHPVYAVMTNLADPYNGGYTAFFEEINNQYDLSAARVIYSKDKIVNPSVGEPAVKTPTDGTVSFILFMESTNKRVVGLDPITGDVVIPAYLDSVPGLGTPKVARLTPRATITISDQISDGVLEYDTLGTPRGYFAPLGGVNNAILDNCRGHIYKPNGNLLVANGSGSNQNTIAEFDNAGNYLGNFIAASSGGLSSPYDILWRTNDVLVTASTSDALHRYDHSGNYLDNLAAGIPFPQQIIEIENGDLLVADFGVGGGVRVYSSTGTLLNLFNVITANRGVWKLGNGNILTSNAAGVHELNGTTGALMRTIIPGVSGQWFAPFDRSIFIPVELTSFNASVENGAVNLVWTTASETNNKGFQIERKKLNEVKWTVAGFVGGKGTTTELTHYSFVDDNLEIERYQYRLKQFDFDGTFSYSKNIEINFTSPVSFSLEQNYPNPFNPNTVIKFSLLSDEFVTLKIYNILGKEVTQLLKGNLKAGIHRVEFSAANLTSGLYFYKIEASNFSSVKKMTLLK